jgi:beta-galactosidase
VAVGDPGKGWAFETWREFVQPTEALKIIDRCVDGEIAFCSDPDGRVHYLAGQPTSAYTSQIIERLCSAAKVRINRLHRDIRMRDNGPIRYIFNYGPDVVDIRQWTDGRPLLLGSDQLPPCGVAAFRRDEQA